MIQAFLDIINVPWIHFLGYWKKESIVHLFQQCGKEGPRSYTPVKLHLCAWESHGTDPPTSYTKVQGVRRMIWDSQHSFTSGKSCLTNPINFNDGVTVMDWTREELQMPFVWISGPFQAKPFFDFEIALNL